MAVWTKIMKLYNHISVRNFVKELYSFIAKVTTKIKYNPQLFGALWKNILQRNVRTAKSLTAKCPYGEVSLRRSVLTAKCPHGEMSLRRSVRTAKCPYGELSYGEVSYGEKSYGEKSGNHVIYYQKFIQLSV